MHISPRFGGVYVKQAKEQIHGVGNITTTVKLAVTNDENGNHLDQFKSITGKDIYSYSTPSHEQVFVYESHSDGYGGSYTRFNAGDNEPIDQTDDSKKALVLQLLDEANGLYPKTKYWMQQGAQYYFRLPSDE